MLQPVVLPLNAIIGIYGNPQRFVTIKTNPLLQKDDYYHLFFHYLCIVHMCSLVILFVLTILLVHIPGSKIKSPGLIFPLFVDQVKVTIQFMNAYFIL